MKQPILLFLGLVLPLMALGQPVSELLTQAEIKKVHGDFKGAITDFTQAITLDPTNANAYVGRASVRSLEGDYAGALADDNKAIALDARNAIAYSNRGNARMMQGDLAGAHADYSQAIKLDPHHVRAFINRGNLKSLQKKYAGAIEDYSAAIAIDPKSAVAYYDRAGAKRALSDYAGALADYSSAIQLNPVDVPAYINRAVLEMAQGNWVASTADLNKCTGLIPDERQAYVRCFLWVIAAEQGNAKKASDDLARQIDAVPKPYSETWGWEIARFLTNREDERTFLNSAISFQAKKNKNQTAQALYYAGLKRALAGDKAGATKFFQECVKNGNPSVQEYILAGEQPKSTGAHK